MARAFEPPQHLSRTCVASSSKDVRAHLLAGVYTAWKHAKNLKGVGALWVYQQGIAENRSEIVGGEVFNAKTQDA